MWLDQPPSVDPGATALDILATFSWRDRDRNHAGAGKDGASRSADVPLGRQPRPENTRTDQRLGYGRRNVTVTLTAKVDHVIWSLGDGTTVTCTGAGTPYQDSFGAAPSPTCGHMYRKPSTALPGGGYPVSATAVWEVDWTGGGEAAPSRSRSRRPAGPHQRGPGLELTLGPRRRRSGKQA